MDIAFWLNQMNCPGVTVIEKTESVSTNNDCRDYITEGDGTPPVLISADMQTGGRGRQGKSFSSPAGGLYMSLLLRPSDYTSDKHAVKIEHAAGITAAAAVAVCEAIEKICGLDCAIKWVNDVYVKGKKLCGILTEAINDYQKGTASYLIVGIGVNLTSFPEKINATSILRETGKDVDKDRLSAAIAVELLSRLPQLFDAKSTKEAQIPPYIDEYRRRSCVIGKKVRCTRGNAVFLVDAVGIDSEGGLTVRYPDGREETLTSGEVTLRVAE